jgi:hypothetical protein
MANLETTWRNNMQMPSFAQAGAAQMAQPTVAQPENRTWEAAQMANNQNAVNQAGNASMWNNIGNAVGSAWGGSGGGGYDPWSGSGSGGNAGVQYSSAGFDPWSGGGGYSAGIWS